MRGLQGSFPWCKKCLQTDNYQRWQILEAIIFIHIFRTEVIRLSQIKTVFDPEYERITTPEGYDWIFQYYLQPGDYEPDDDSEKYDNEPDYDNNSNI